MDGEQEKKSRPEEGKSERELRGEERRQKRGERRSRRRIGRCCNFGRLLIGFFVVFIGLLLLARSTNFIPESFMFDLSRFWPLFMVAFGLSLLETRNRLVFLIGFITLLLTVAMFAIFLREESMKNKQNGGIINNQESPNQPATNVVMDISCLDENNL